MKPFTRAYPKELLPVGEKAVIEHCIEDMKNAGIADIVVVVGWKQHAILDYLGSGEELGVQLTYVVQENRTGLAHAVKAAEHLVEDRFAVVLGDNYVDEKDALKDLVEFHNDREFNATIGSFEAEDVSSHGVIAPGENNIVEGLVEKPSPEEAPSKMAIAGMYVFEPEIFESIDRIEEGHGGEHQLTDAIDHLRKEQGGVGYREIKGSRIDVGTPERLRKANKEFDLK